MATYYVCKYTPLEIIEALGGTPVNLNTMQEGFDQAELLVGANICGFGKTVIESVYNGDVRELVLVNCCDSIKSVYDVLADSGKSTFCICLMLCAAMAPAHVIGWRRRSKSSFGHMVSIGAVS